MRRMLVFGGGLLLAVAGMFTFRPPPSVHDAVTLIAIAGGAGILFALLLHAVKGRQE